MNEASNCRGTTCDKAKLKADQSQAVDAFDAFDKRQAQFNYMDPDIDGLEKAFEELKQAIACLREKQ